MKFLFLFLAFFVAAQAYTNDHAQEYQTKEYSHAEHPFTSYVYGAKYGTKYGTTITKQVSKEFSVRQRNLLRLFQHIHSRNTFEEQYNVGKQFHFESNFDKFENVQAVKEFLSMYKYGMLPRNKVFVISNQQHRDEAVALFHVFYYAKDFDTFYRSACWARDHINEGTFVYAMTVAVLHRHDTKGMRLPAPYEVYPFYFFNSEVISKAQRVKSNEGLAEDKLANYYGVHKIDNNNYYINSNYSGYYIDTNRESTLSYFTEDIGLNSYYYYFHATYPFWMQGESYGLSYDRRGEWYLYKHQQLLARYYMERLSTNLGEIHRFMWQRPIKTGYTSSLIHHDGLPMPSRPNDFLLYTEDNQYDLHAVQDYEMRIRDAIDQGYVETEDGKRYSLYKPEDVETLGLIMQASRDSPNSRYYHIGSLAAKSLLGNAPDSFDDAMVTPAVLEQYETALRDPVYYQLCQRYVHYYLKFKETLRPYTREEVSFPGVKINDVEVDKLVTYFEQYDSDITNAVYRKQEEIVKNYDQFYIRARQHRLNHLPFDVKIDLFSEKTSTAVIKFFLGPKYDSMHREIDFNENRVNFFELDSFTYDLKQGKNVISRNSREFSSTSGDFTPIREYFQKINACVAGNDECTVEATHVVGGFPDRLVLPKGKRQGMPFVLFVSVTPVHNTHIYNKKYVAASQQEKASTEYYSSTGLSYVDDHAFGYPLDRTIDYTQFFNPNFYVKDVIVDHKTYINKIDKEDSSNYDAEYHTKEEYSQYEKYHHQTGQDSENTPYYH